MKSELSSALLGRTKSNENLDNKLERSNTFGSQRDTDEIIKARELVKDNTDREEFEDPLDQRWIDIKVNKDIYALAFCSLLESKELDHGEKDCVPFVNVNKRQLSNLFMGAFLVIGFQLILIFLILNYMLYSPDFKVINPESVLIIIPRFLSSLMMHLSVEPDTRSGMNLMKYAINHPTKFKKALKLKKDEEDDYDRNVESMPFLEYITH